MTLIPKPQEPGGPAHRSALRLAFNLLVLGFAFWFLWRVLGDIGIVAVGRRLLEADAFLVLAVLAANVARFLLLALRWEILVRGEAPVGFAAIQSVLMAGNFVGLVTPVVRVAGPVLRAFYLSKETGRPRARFYGTIVADQTANFSIFATAMVVSGVITAGAGHEGISVASGAALLAALAGGLYVGWRHLSRIRNGETSQVVRFLRTAAASRVVERIGGRWRAGERFIAWWEHLLEALAETLIGRRTWWPALGVSAVLFLLLAAAQALAFSAVGAPIGLASAAFAVSAASFIQILAAAPGGPGITEASLVVILLALGVDAESAAAGAFLARLMNYLVLIPWGGVCFYRLQRRYGTVREPDDASAVEA